VNFRRGLIGVDALKKILSICLERQSWRLAWPALPRLDSSSSDYQESKTISTTILPAIFPSGPEISSPPNCTELNEMVSTIQ